MKFKIFFLTIIIQKNKLSKSELSHEQQIHKAVNDIKIRQSLYCSRL
ncbi:YrzI family small protein [Bacillus cytotoxicus]|nr:YrzI family small protein [Bacillus cytotoxicus]AWC28877.1 YrzI family small protein [Bacillus cytotoxicus]AWC39737.1 YrzI family small protein [Bacillus cytotoxicus]AWC47668.1 YrzI family small protein [Bacillus cytotoxicus]AWC52946.1 YrzI family small protein [Bacillus cytotoxicus]AWC57078.1 YrzI family small protein [Bacillus cytotoxicus]